MEINTCVCKQSAPGQVRHWSSRRVGWWAARRSTSPQLSQCGKNHFLPSSSSSPLPSRPTPRSRCRGHGMFLPRLAGNPNAWMKLCKGDGERRNRRGTRVSSWWEGLRLKLGGIPIAHGRKQRYLPAPVALAPSHRGNSSLFAKEKGRWETRSHCTEIRMRQKRRYYSCTLWGCLASGH